MVGLVGRKDCFEYQSDTGRLLGTIGIDVIEWMIAKKEISLDFYYHQ